MTRPVSTLSSADARAFRAAYEKLVADIRPNLALTLDAGHACSPAILLRDARKFFNKIQHQARGRNWAKRPAENWPVAIGFIEHLDSNPHLHVACRATDVNLRGHLYAGEKVWRSIRAAGHYYCESLEQVANFARYTTKDLWRDVNRDHVFIYRRTDAL